METGQELGNASFSDIELPGSILPLKLRLQEQLHQSLSVINPELTLSIPGIPLYPKLTAIALHYRCALAFKLAPLLDQSPIQCLARLQPWLPRRLALMSDLIIPLDVEAEIGGGFSFVICYQDLLLWFQRLTLICSALRQNSSFAVGISAPAPLGVYQYIHARLCGWLRLWEASFEPNLDLSPFPLVLKPSAQDLLAALLLAIDDLPMPEQKHKNSQKESLCSAILAVMDDYPLGVFQANPDPSLLMAVWGLLNLAQWLLQLWLEIESEHPIPNEL